MVEKGGLAPSLGKRVHLLSQQPLDRGLTARDHQTVTDQGEVKRAIRRGEASPGHQGLRPGLQRRAGLSEHQVCDGVKVSWTALFRAAAWEGDNALAVERGRNRLSRALLAPASSIS